MPDPVPSNAPPTDPTHTDGPLSEQQHLRDYLIYRDIPCPACGYNLRQLQSSTCPECGRGLKLTIGVEGLSNLWITALVAAIVPAACGLPFNILLLIGFANGLSPSDITSEPQGIVFLLLVLYGILCVPASITLLATRQNFMRMRISTQRTISFFLVTTTSIAAFIALLLLANIASL